MIEGLIIPHFDPFGITRTVAIHDQAAIEVKVGTSKVQPDLLGHLLQGLQTLGQEHHIRVIDRRHRDRR